MSPSQSSLATAAAHQAVIGTSALLQFAKEGPELHETFADEAIEKLADALKMALELDAEVSKGEGRRSDDERDQLLAACARYLWGWAG